MKKLIVGFMIILCLGIFFINTYGIGSANISMDTSKKEIRPHEEFFVNINMKNIGSAQSPITGMETTLDFDNSLFEKVTENSIALYNLDCNLSYNEATHRLVVLRPNMKDNSCMIKVKFIAKSKINVDSVVISTKDTSVLKGSDSFTTNTSNVELKINHQLPIATVSNKNNTMSKSSGDTNSQMDELTKYTDNITKAMSGLKNNMPFINSTNGFDTKAVITMPIKLIGIFIGTYLAVLLFNLFAKWMCGSFITRKEIMKNRKVSRKLRKVLVSIDK
ncbi:MAG: hypothetical protein RSE00_04550 [Clostridia bacterium]